MLFIVSDVRVQEGAGLSIATDEGGRREVRPVLARRAVGRRAIADHQGLCDRCVDALAEPVGS